MYLILHELWYQIGSYKILISNFTKYQILDIDGNMNIENRELFKINIYKFVEWYYNSTSSDLRIENINWNDTKMHSCLTLMVANNWYTIVLSTS